jgi:hypothetical protein
MVKDTVWPIGDLDGMLCVGCIEQRIGRRLTPQDFTDAPTNWVPLQSGGHSARLTDRMTGAGTYTPPKTSRNPLTTPDF